MSVPSDAALLDLARAAAARAYAPYSQFSVGAALLLTDGSVVTGCNVENASYGLAMCAERVAVGRAVADGLLGGAAPGEAAPGEDAPGGAAPGGAVQIVAAAVVGLQASPCFPCGACRQVLHEFGCARVVVDGDAGGVTVPFTELLPHAFGPADL